MNRNRLIIIIFIFPVELKVIIGHNDNASEQSNVADPNEWL